ncbi:outer membrane beta-barrel protein [Spirosoma utsteinense]|uniref:Outer membrane protein X n=1 Tax=Spirosoma utsteinense TaxID=2585773 RepID=A0ABR6WBM2_9BACT|nr:outer membrane beta-barrel protein [Spirosoma utsteinense]MBC3785298.1 outer membrane protein X [Spirosoma utsteinense]MBC3793898.1 outer membrane protein X [Spirosoma utsteinense]
MKVSFLPLLLLLTGSASAQVFKPFKVNISMGYAKPLEAASMGGILLSLEPKYGLNDRVDLGLRYELGLMNHAYTVDNGSGTSELKGASSFVFTGNYLLSESNFRPFVGAGLGVFTVGGVSFSEGDGGVSGGTKLGAMVRAGFKAGHFAFGAEYNLIPSSTGVMTSASSVVQRYKSPNAYLGLKIGFDIGGGAYE